MHDQQIEILSKGLTDLTVDIRFDKLEQAQASMQQDIAGMKRT
jgi:hypothetical protein